jgi:hypothetical protein
METLAHALDEVEVQNEDVELEVEGDGEEEVASEERHKKAPKSPKERTYKFILSQIDDMVTRKVNAAMAS